jgi:carotenoid 1,2-hydratase
MNVGPRAVVVGGGVGAGDEPLEAGFRRWSWWRVEEPGGALRVGYHAELRDGGSADASCRVRRDGSREALPAATLAALGRKRWGVARRAEVGVQIVETLEDTPFYARSVVRTGAALGVHETVSLDRFRTWWVQRMIPYRMRREEAPA